MLLIKKILISIKKSFLFALLFIVGSIFQAPAQSAKFNRISLPEGVHFGIINGITQDPQGYMWFAVYDGGLRQYDGYHFKTYMRDSCNPNSLISNALETVYADSKGIIWAGTQYSGLDRLDPSTGLFTHFRHDPSNLNSISNDSITAILEDHNGMIWVGTMRGLNRFDPNSGTFTRFIHNRNDTTSLSCNQVQVLYEDRKNTLWVGTNTFLHHHTSYDGKGGLNRFESKNNTFTRYLHDSGNPESLIDNRVGAIFEDSHGTFWVGTAENGLHTMDRAKGIFQRHLFDSAHPEKLSGPPQKKEVALDLNLFFICEDGTGSVWIGLSGGWITRYDTKTNAATHYDSFNDDAQAMQAVSGALTSRDGILWLTTWMGSIYRFDPFQITISHVFLGNIVHHVYQDKKGLLWLSGYYKGLIQIQPDKNLNYTSNGSFTVKKMPDSIVTAIYEEDENIMWIGTQRGLNCYNRKTKKSKLYIHNPHNNFSLSDGHITAIIKDIPGYFWIGTDNGLDRLNVKKGEFSHYRNNPDDSNSLSNNYIWSLLKDHTGSLWINSHHGSLNRFDPSNGKFKHFQFTNIIGTIAVDNENIIWAGTSDGLYRSNKAHDSFYLFTDLRIGITPRLIVSGIIEDNQQNLWISSTTGIFKLDKKRNKISVYNQNQSVDPSGFSFVEMKATKGMNGELFFANKSGYYTFFPEQFRTNTTPPQIIIREFRISDRLVKPNNNGPLTLPITQTNKINLSHDQNTFSFDFTSIHYSSQDNNQHLYMLENLDKNWQKTGPEKRASYYNVPPGRYVFRLKAANRDGVWAEKAIEIVITPPWWSNWWFRLATATGLVLLLYGLIRWRLSEKFRKQLEHSEKEKQLSDLKHKTAELEMQALRAQMNPHFIFNSLNSINGFVMENDKSKASQYLTKFSRLVRLILQNSQATMISLESELEALKLYLELEAVRFDHHFAYDIVIADDLNTSVLKVPPLIIQPYAENAIWHGLMHKEETGNLRIELFKHHNVLCCKITDDGIGRRNAAALKKKSASTYKSAGMRITSDRIELLQEKQNINAFIKVTDVVLPDGTAGGTEVLLKIPLFHD